ncbi:hypothetical protein FRX31_026143 [Thalictrum thalictroides]|uniref:F-box protein skip23 n=1 Tax=Thalictrum thalictroides TaxID=46969 RepID=A0A7J6VJC0_THATH|nr:hypothetical protein FRX31_026143 [Thalictrum thalictroides]
MGDWSQLQLDLLDLIIRRLTLRDMICFSCVCTSWKSVFATICHHKGGRFPWLIVPSQNNSKQQGDSWKLDTLCFYSILEEKCYSAEIPEIEDCRICSSSNGWLITVHENYDVQLLHPFSRKVIKLPSLKAIPKGYSDQATFYRHNGNTVEVVDALGYIEDHPQFARDFLLKRAIIAPPPNHHNLNSDNVGPSHPPLVMGIFKYYSKLVFCRPNLEEEQNATTSWKVIGGDHQNFSYEDLTYYKGKFYAISSDGFVVVVEGIADSLPVTRVIDIRNSDPIEALFWCKYYLVELSGDLLKVMRMQDSTFKVFKLDITLFWWEEVLSLDKCALFLGSNQSFSLSTSDFPGYRGNRIYFTDDRCFKQGPLLDKGVFNLEDGTVERFHPDIFQLELPRTIWYASGHP